MFEGFLKESIIGRARERGLIVINTLDIREETTGRHRTADDSPFGGGAGMVMLAKPVLDLLSKVRTGTSRTIMLTPSGKKFDQIMAAELAGCEHLIILCGHYEGFDERISGSVDMEVSIGDFVITGGEIAAAALVDAVSRHVPGVVKEMDSVENDSFSDGLLEGPHYTRPSDLDGAKVPEVLLNGNHEEIRKWRRKRSLEKTLKVRPDLLATADITPEDRKFLTEIIAVRPA